MRNLSSRNIRVESGRQLHISDAIEEVELLGAAKR